MAARSRFSIALLMAVVMFVAADFAIVRALWHSSDDEEAIAAVTLPTVNLLLLAAPRLRHRGEARPFWAGFEVAGWLTVALVALAGWSQPEAFFAPVVRLDRVDPFELGSDAETGFLFTFAVVFYTLPQVLAAWIGGRLSARYRVVIERRP